MKRVFIAGATGSMGKQVVQLVEKQADCELVGVLAPHAKSEGDFANTVQCFDQLDEIDISADIWTDN